MVDVIAVNSSPQRKDAPAAGGPLIETELISGFQSGQRSIVVRISHTTAGSASISISRLAATADRRPMGGENTRLGLRRFSMVRVLLGAMGRR